MRAGGVSRGPFAGLNLDDRQDDAHDVAENRRRLAAAFGRSPEQIARLDQVHGTEVRRARRGVQEGDALVSDDPSLLLAIGTADCYPLLIADAEAGVVGAAHAGWRGTVGDIARHTVNEMVKLGARPERMWAAIGVGISQAQYTVGSEVAAAFEAADLEDCLDGPRLDLRRANLTLLTRTGLRPEHISTFSACSTEPAFYSYRRDNGRTGRMWAVVSAPLEAGQ